MKNGLVYFGGNLNLRTFKIMLAIFHIKSILLMLAKYLATNLHVSLYFVSCKVLMCKFAMYQKGLKYFYYGIFVYILESCLLFIFYISSKIIAKIFKNFSNEIIFMCLLCSLILRIQIC